ncbi:hypothetical protein [Streptomyces sp. NPDC016845]|uniref:hypothetical protein n=1 Tax=Streptomyces sp. NPDC016845 TaxID=3364972 RepID=UPI003798AD6A
MGRRSVRGGLLPLAMSGALFLGTTGCGGDGADDGLPDDYKVVSATQLCGGRAVTAEASKALKVITGSSRFEASGERNSVQEAALRLAEAAPLATRTEDVCLIFTPMNTRHFELGITWQVADDAPSGPSAPEFTELKMGELAVTAPNKSYVFFACKSDKLLGPSSAVHIVIGVRPGGMPTEPEGDDGELKALKDAYATVAHSFSLAMAKELGCADNGGLPARPVLLPA